MTFWKKKIVVQNLVWQSNLLFLFLRGIDFKSNLIKVQCTEASQKIFMLHSS